MINISKNIMTMSVEKMVQKPALAYVIQFSATVHIELARVSKALSVIVKF